MQNKIKILILVLSVKDNRIYSSFFNVQRKTWDSIKVEGIDTFYFFGNSSEEKIVSNAIYLTIAEGYQNCGYKTIRTFELTKDLDYDYIFRTNSSSYIDKEFLSEYLRNKPRNKYYSGIIGDHNGIKYAPGSGYVLSRDLVNIVLENVAQWDHSYIDDVSLGLVLKSKGHTPTPGPRFDNHTKNIFQLFSIRSR